MEQILNIDNLNLSFGPKQIFTKAQFQINRGDRIGLLGLNGKGKSCLLKVLNSELSPDVTDPACKFVKSNTLYSVCYIPQELPLPSSKITPLDYFFYFFPEVRKIKENLDKVTTLLERKPSGSELNKLVSEQKEILEIFERKELWKQQDLYKSYLKHFGLLKFDQDIHHFSGGEKRKILIALGLSSPAQLILWDEPTNHLDLESITNLEQELLLSGKSFVLISHDRYLLSKVTNKILQINQCKIDSFTGSYTDYLDFLRSEEEARKVLLSRLKNRLKREQDWMNQGIKARGTRSKKRVEGYLDLKGKVSAIKDAAKKELNLSIGQSERKSKKLFSIKNGSFGYDSDKKIIKDISLEVYKKDKIGILGPNGAGKTTLIKLMTEELNLSSGEIKRADLINIGHFKQIRNELSPDETPYSYLGDGTDSVTLPSGRKMHVAGYIKRFLFTGEDLYRPLKTFSGGERNRIQLAKNLLTPADIWIFDEPTNDLDLETINVLEQELSSFDGSLIIVSHDRAFLSNITNKIWILDNQSIEIFSGGYSQSEQYLEALALEKEFEKEMQKNISPATTNDTETSKKAKPTNREKNRLKELPSLIEKAEELIEKLEASIESFNFGDGSAEKAEKFAKISTDKENLEEKLLLFYEELEDLQEKFN